MNAYNERTEIDTVLKVWNMEAAFFLSNCKRSKVTKAFLVC